MSADDDEIDDLFSFSTDTPSSAILGSTQNDGDMSKNAAMSREKSDSFDFDDLGPAPSATTTSSRINIDDDMDDIFGSSTIGTASKEIETTSGDDDFLDILGDVPNSEKSPNNLTVQEKEETTTSTPDSDEYVKLDSTVGEEIQHPVTLQEDDFHKHDSGTRDFLEWLDKDGPGEKDSGVSSGDKILTSSPSLDISITSPTNDVSDEEDTGFDFAKDILGEKAEEDEPKKEDIVVDAKDEHVENEEKSEKSSTDPSPTIVAIPDTPVSPKPSETESPDTITESSTTNSKSNDDKVEEPSTGDEPETKVVPPPSPPKEIIEFSTLSEAIESMDSSLKQIKELYQIEKSDISQAERANFYLKIICGKTVDNVMNNSSIADSFRHWKNVQFETEKEESDIPYQGLISLLKEESSLYTDNICKALSLEEDSSEISSSLFSLLLFHYKNGGYKSQENKSSWDPLLFPVVSSILSAGVPAVAASVVLNNIFPVAMPLMALTGDERFEAAKTLHGKFYLLAAYNLPLLVLHLDKFIPGWHLPKKIPDPEEIARRSKSPEKSKVVEDDENGEEDEDSSTKKGRNLEANGSIPISWFVSLFADDKSLRNPNLLLRLWDILLVTGDPSLKYFLVLSVLEDHSDALLMLRGKALEIQIQSIMQSQLVLKEEDKDEEYQFVQDWCRRAKVLVESTPKSVVAELSKAEDEAVTYALLQRQMKAEERLQARLDAEAEAHRAAAELEKKKRQEENNYQDHKKFLIKYYEKYNPEKVDAVDEILERYKGRLEELDDNLADKYGHGFIPVNKKISTSTAKLFSSINLRRNRMIQKVNFKSKDTEEELQKAEDKNLLLKHQVAVEVSPDEILPVICTPKAQTMEKDESTDYLVARGRYSTDDVYIPLKFYLVDSRPDHVSEAQGKFPTAVNLGPEAMHDPEKLQKELEMFESFRGAVHICVMGEGIASFPQLYSHELNAQERALAEEDTSRTSMCALFFIKKGFPFVSILKGGFAGAHAFLSREGPSKSLYASSVLVDYDENLSLHSRLEHEYAEFLKNGSHSVRKKIGTTVHNMLDASLVKLTQSVQIIDEFAEDIDHSESKQKFMSRFFRGGENNEDDSSLGSAPTNNNEEEDATSPEESTKQESSKFEMRFKNIFNKSENDEQSSDAEKNTEVETDGSSSGEQKKLKWNFLSKSPSPGVSTNENEEEITEEEEGVSKASKWKFSFSRSGDDVSTTDTETLDESKGSDTESSDPVDNKKPLFQMKNLFSKAATSPEGDDDEVAETDTEKETADEAASTTSIKSRFSKPSFQVKNPFASNKGVESPAEPNNDNDEEQQSSSADETKTMANLRTRFSNFSMKVQAAAAASAEDTPQQDSRAIYDFMSSGNPPVPKKNMFTGMSRKLFDKEKKKDGVEDSPELVKENKPASTPSFSTKMFQRSPFKKKNDTELANVLSDDDSSAPSDLSLNEDPTPSVEQSEKSGANDAEEDSAAGETSSSVKVDEESNEKAQDTNTVPEHASSTSSMEGVELDDI